MVFFSKRRSKVEIAFETLKAIQLEEGLATRTHLMYATNQTWKSTVEILEYLEGVQLVARVDQGTRPVHRLTKDGEDVLAAWEAITKRLGVNHKIYLAACTRERLAAQLK